MKKMRWMQSCVCVLLVILLASTTVLADNDDNDNDDNHNHGGSGVNTGNTDDHHDKDLKDYINATLASGNYYLSASLELTTNLTIAEYANVSICLNDKTLTWTGSSGTSIITVKSGATLTICGGNRGNGIITGGNATSGGAIYVERGGTVNIAGGIITNNTATNGGGVYVENSGTLDNTGGTITDNTATNGGGVYVENGGTLDNTGGTITDNTATSGGGVYVADGGTLDNTDGTITGNTATLGGESNILEADPDDTQGTTQEPTLDYDYTITGSTGEEEDGETWAAEPYYWDAEENVNSYGTKAIELDSADTLYTKFELDDTYNEETGAYGTVTMSVSLDGGETYQDVGSYELYLTTAKVTLPAGTTHLLGTEVDTSTRYTLDGDTSGIEYFSGISFYVSTEADYRFIEVTE